jgi:hypothetical protein
MMKITLAFMLLAIMLLCAPLYAQSLCAKCIEASQAELKKCLDEAISQEDKKSCLEKQEKRAKACDDGDCKIERTQGGSPVDVPPEKK